MKTIPENLLLFLILCIGCLRLEGAPDRQDSLSAITVLHYADEHGVPLVNVSIGGHTYSFLFDTGAGMTCISDHVVSTENLPTRAMGHYVEGMSGNVPLATIPSLTLGNRQLENLAAIVLPRNNPGLRSLGIDGIIGANVLLNYIVTFDARTKTITVADSTADEQTAWEPMKLWDGLPLLSLKLRGNEDLYDVPGVFDSGSDMGAFGLPSVEGFEQWTTAGIIGDVVEGRGTTTLMLGGRAGMDKLYRGKLKECHIGNGIYPGIPVYTGGMGYLLLCFKITNLGKLTLDYPNKRFSFIPYEGTKVWEGDKRPVVTVSTNGQLKIVAVWGKKALEKLAPGDEIIALDGKPAVNVPAAVPNIDVFIAMIQAKTVTVRHADGKEETLPAELFLPESTVSPQASNPFSFLR